jgi:hypothetical protein
MLHEFVLEAVANDYESFECVAEQVIQWSTERGVSVTRRETAEALGWAICEGYAGAYQLSPQPPYCRRVVFSEERLGDLWYFVTPKGKQFVKDLETQLDQ